MKLHLLVFLLVSMSCGLHAAQRVPGTKVALEPPAGFVQATQFPGYMMQSTGSSIMVTPIPGGPFSEVSKGFTPEDLATKGMTLIGKEERKVGSTDAILLHLGQAAHGTEFLKWMLVFGDDSETTLVVATFPKQFAGDLSEKLKSSVLSTEWIKAEQVNFFEGLTFRVAESGPLKTANRMGNNLFLTEGGIFPVREKGAAMVVVGASISEDWKIPGSKKDFANKRLEQTEVLTSLKVEQEKAVQVDGLDGYLIHASGLDKESGKTIYIEQCLLFTKDGYYIFQALVEEERKEEFRAHFHEILQSFKHEPPVG